MGYEVKWTTELPELKSKTHLFDRLQIWTDEDVGSVTPTWESNYGDALMSYATEFDEDLGYWLMDDFNEVVDMDDAPTYSIFERALCTRSWSTSEWKGSVNTVDSPANFADFRKAKHFAFGRGGRVYLFKDELSLKAWLEDRVDTDGFVKWIAENKANVNG